MGSLIERGANIIGWIKASIKPCARCKNTPLLLQEREADGSYRLSLECACKIQLNVSVNSGLLIKTDSAKELVERWNSLNQ